MRIDKKKLLKALEITGLTIEEAISMLNEDFRFICLTDTWTNKHGGEMARNRIVVVDNNIYDSKFVIPKFFSFNDKELKQSYDINKRFEYLLGDASLSKILAMNKNQLIKTLTKLQKETENV